MRQELIRCPDAPGIFQYMARLFSRLSRENAYTRGRFSVALSGGSTPRGLYGQLAAEPYRSAIDWTNVHCFWGDERCVPPDHSDSNYRMAHTALLGRVPIPDSNIHRPRAEDSDPAKAAEDYEQEIRAFFSLERGEFPRFGLVLLGMGEDGHTASLFPNSAALGETSRIFVHHRVDQLNADRLTLTFPAINNAETVAVLVSGRSKARVLQEVLNGPARYPIQQVNPVNGRLLIVADQDALQP